MATAPVGSKQYVIYDERAILGDTDDAAVLESCGSLREVRRSSFRRGAVYEYTINERGEGVNETFLGTVNQLRGELK